MVRDKLGRVIRGVNHLAHDVKELAVHVAKTGELKAHDQIIRNRLGICSSCDRFDGRTCSVCGCHMKWKVVLASSVCPIGRWK